MSHSCQFTDPRFGNVILDANALDASTENRTNVDRFLELKNSGKISVVVPAGVITEAKNPNTPNEVTRNFEAQIFSIDTSLTSEEKSLLEKIQKILKGNAKSDKHDADAKHIFDGYKHGGRYFITHDKRITHEKRNEIESLLPGFEIVTLEKFLHIFGSFERSQELRR